MQERAVIVWSLDRSTYHVEGTYSQHAHGKALLYAAARQFPGHDVERVTGKTLQHLEAIS